MNKNYYSVIMAGGVGARFWPLSRTARPKQFIDILGTGETLIQQTFRRLASICPTENIYIVTHENYKALVLEQLPAISEQQILCEPVRRNTAPCIAYATNKIAAINPAASVIVSPSDHIILNEDQFRETLFSALEAATNNDWLLTLGIMPSRPDTGYGYIQFDDSTVFGKDASIRKVKTFTEKPHLELAESFLQSGDFLWNSGIFVWSLNSIRKAFNEHLPDVDQIFKDVEGHYFQPTEAEFISKAYTLSKSISIDYGVMEKASNVYVIPSNFGWSDLGTWSSLFEARNKNEDGNSINEDNTLTFNTSNCIISLPENKLAVIQGLKDFIVVEDNGTLLICNRNEEQHIREFLDVVRLTKGEQYL